MKKTVCVYMSTYNGEKYLRFQIDSILLQNNVNVSLVIRDDGSNDDTCNILADYEKKYDNITVIKGHNVGYANSFLELFTRNDHADYYALSDQDDIWNVDKLINAITHLEEAKSSLYASSLNVVNEENEFLSIKSFPRYTTTIGSTLSRNRLAGCTFVMDKHVANIIKQNVSDIIKVNEKIAYGHDGWILLFTLLSNKKLYLDSSAYINYRRHNDTVTCVDGGLKKRIQREIKNSFNNNNRRECISSFLLSVFGDDNSSSDVLYDIISYKHSLKSKLKLLFSSEINTGLFVVDILNRVCILLNKY